MSTRVMDAVGIIGQLVSSRWEEIVDQLEVAGELSNQGFSEHEIEQAFQWIEANTLGIEHQASGVMPGSFRILTNKEKARLSPKAQGLLFQYVEGGALPLVLAEEVLEKAMVSDADILGAKEIKRLISLALFTQVQGEWREFLHRTNTLIH